MAIDIKNITYSVSGYEYDIELFYNAEKTLFSIDSKLYEASESNSYTYSYFSSNIENIMNFILEHGKEKRYNRVLKLGLCEINFQRTGDAYLISINSYDDENIIPISLMFSSVESVKKLHDALKSDMYPVMKSIKESLFLKEKFEKDKEKVKKGIKKIDAKHFSGRKK